LAEPARRRVVTDVSLSRRVASTQCFRRRRATSACSARRTLAAYLSSAVCGAVLAEPHARRPMNPLGLPRKCHGSLSEVPPSGPNPREVDLPQLSPWTLACVRDTQHLRQHKLIAAAPGASTSPPSKCRWATWSVHLDGLVPNFESLATLTSSPTRVPSCCGGRLG